MTVSDAYIKELFQKFNPKLEHNSELRNKDSCRVCIGLHIELIIMLY
jgi:hypothetical protein